MTADTANQENASRDRIEQTILSAAEQVFSQHGYRGASLQAIADQAKLPKANILYYMGSKQALYVRLLNRMMNRWNAVLEDITEDSDPGQVLSDFIRTKMMLGQRYPEGSKLFAAEILAGAPFLKEYLAGELKEWVASRAVIIRQWAQQGKMDDVDPRWLIFLIWSATQHYTEYSAQVTGILGEEALSEADLTSICQFLEHVILKGCGITSSNATSH
ncbi:MAG: TetR family transcriptional regulator C-terminal domain-containing protein [Halomonas sp.]|jgi:TetR/AcrR family transcriptional regulator|uniref:TetR family transcriptional regulator C-terminal domain-containing protein n=1 Tax=Vreelandella aquamarina TaxID=77097 RepID=UPI0007334775|nr:MULTISPECIES: TetR family transcriptional regulator C-terminal domain-containing protein [Halomonas]KTG29192.1 TetR family transcriptional regulator [Idiomarina sp. H105]MEE3112412.1 TetR family transcriptional regulator C-terminal domain-containing protein [Pseudomonadota bacterium]OAF10137.1 TetR family transcriptional regulator [Idiomarina sp. WRN-38]MCD1649759.1 TetR family transcriptional regulator C-terminal domain-containing protein [Halomonas axialensis]MCD2088130.1 TetR family tran|tara:strand:+ start:1109 stop:1759 length:651 start_codon:yes stop_codon:yes gene_type:complete